MDNVVCFEVELYGFSFFLYLKRKSSHGGLVVPMVSQHREREIDIMFIGPRQRRIAEHENCLSWLHVPSS